MARMTSLAESARVWTGTGSGGLPSARTMLNKVPEVTLYFWIIKVLCTTVGETGADYLNENLGFGLTKTTLLASSSSSPRSCSSSGCRRYVPGIYWLAVVLISIVGTLITDNLTDNFGVSLVTTTVVFSDRPGGVFAAWYASEKTLSIHTIVTTRREAFYWLTVLFTFALGTAAGDLTAERLAVGYWKSALLFGALIALVYVLHLKAGLNAILAFWIAYILTRPLGASIGDYLSQPRADGGLGLGTTVTSAIFLLTILAVVIYLSVTRVDSNRGSDRIEHKRQPGSVAIARRAPRILVVANKIAATPALVEAVRQRAARAQRSSSCSCRTPPTWRSTATAPTCARATVSSRPRCRNSRKQPAPRSKDGSPRAPTPTTTSCKNSTAAATTRSSSRHHPATSRTGSTSISANASHTSATHSRQSWRPTSSGPHPESSVETAAARRAFTTRCAGGGDEVCGRGGGADGIPRSTCRALAPASAAAASSAHADISNQEHMTHTLPP